MTTQTPSRESRVDSSPVVERETPRDNILRGTSMVQHPDALVPMTALLSICAELVVALRNVHQEYGTLHSMTDRLERQTKTLLDAHDETLIANLKKSKRECTSCSECDPRNKPLLQLQRCLHTMCMPCITQRLAQAGQGQEISVACPRCPVFGLQTLCVNQDILPLQAPQFVDRPFVPLAGWTTPTLRRLVEEGDLPESPSSQRLLSALRDLLPEMEW